MTTYQDVVTANAAIGAWALTEAAGFAFAPYIGGSGLVGSGAISYRQPGPFAPYFSVGLAVGAKLTLTFVQTVNPPVTNECWIKLASATPTTLTQLMYFGNTGANGTGLYVATNGHIHMLAGGRGDTDTGLIWPDTNWHLVQRAANQDSVTQTIAIDGIVRWRAAPIVPNAPSPNVLTFGGDSGAGAATALSVSMPAFYAYELTPGEMYASFLASTDPTGALVTTLTAGGGQTGSTSDLLTRILNAVQKTFPTT